MDILYKVKKGEKLSEIANNFCTTIEQIVQDNNVTSPVLENQVLIISQSNGVIYVVKPFANLQALQKVLKEYNTSKYNCLYPFQRIKIYNKL